MGSPEVGQPVCQARCMIMFAKNFRRYWQQRHKIFSMYDSGIYLTDDLWYGVTPEPIARYVKQRIQRALYEYVASCHHVR